MITPITATFPALNFPKEVDYPTQNDWAAFSAAAELNYGILSGEWSDKSEEFKEQTNNLALEIHAIGENAFNAISLNTIEDLATYSGTGLVMVKDISRGGTFVSKSVTEKDPNTGSIYTVNDGTIFAKQGGGFWVRQYSGAVNVKWFGAKGDGVTDDTSILNYCSNNFNTVWIGTFLISDVVNIRYDANLQDAFIISSTETSYLNVSNNANIRGGEIDCSNISNYGVYIDNSDSTIKNTTVRNSVSSASDYFGIYGKIGGDYTIVLDSVKVIDCPKGIRIVGTGTKNNNNLQGNAKLINCSTLGSTGSESNIYMLINMKTAQVLGGYFKGAAVSGPNIYIVDECSITNGIYDGLNRGPTVGQNTTRFTISGNSVVNMGFSGISVDLRDDGVNPPDGEHPRGYGAITGNTINNTSRPFYIQGKNITVSGNHIDTFSSSSRVNGGDNIYFSANSFVNPIGAIASLEAGSSSIVTLGDNYFGENSAISHASIIHAVDSDSKFIYDNNVSTSVTNEDLENSIDTIYADATNGSITVRLPKNSILKSNGKEVKVIKIDNTLNDVTIAVEGGEGSIIGSNKLDKQGASTTFKTINPSNKNWYAVSGYQVARNVTDSSATTIEGLNSKFNSLLAELRRAGLLRD